MAGQQNTDEMSGKEKKKRSVSGLLMIVIPLCLFILFFVGAVIFVIPRQKDISKSDVFSEETVISCVKRDIEYLNSGDYEAVRANATQAMEPVIKDGLMESIQQQTGTEWGAFTGFGDISIIEMNQGGQKYAVSDIKADYENISVTFRLTYDKDMKLAGLYVR